MEKDILSNSIKYIIIPNKNVKVVSIKYIIKCGFYNEYSGVNNFTHLLEHLFAYYFNKKQCTVNKVKKILSKKIYTTNAYTMPEEMCIWIKCYQKDIDFFLNLLSRTIFDLCITSKNFDLSKKNVIKELKQLENYELDDSINTYVYERNNVNIKNAIKDVEKCNLEDINNFYKNIFSKNMIIGITCNKKNLKKNKKLIIKYFNKKIEIKKNIYPINFKSKILNTNKIYKIHKPIKSVEINIIIPFNIQIYTAKYWELKIILNYLFNFDIGPFYKKLRNIKKIIYSIGYNLYYCYDDSNKTLLHIKSNCQQEKVEEFLEIFNKLFKTFNIKNNEFNITKKKLIFNKSYDYMNDIDDCLDYNLNNYLYNRDISHKNNIDNLNKAKKNINLIKELKNKKYYVFLFNEKFKKI
jgi:predicted Zn-dependent peptidase